MAAEAGLYVCPKIEDVINSFEAFGYDDELLGQEYQEKLFQEHAENKTKPSDPERIKKVILHELNIFAKIIRARKEKDQIWVHGRDARYGHLYVHEWILKRWFIHAPDFKSLPSWYQAECRAIGQLDSTGDMETMVRGSLDRLQPHVYGLFATLYVGAGQVTHTLGGVFATEDLAWSSELRIQKSPLRVTHVDMTEHNRWTHVGTRQDWDGKWHGGDNVPDSDFCGWIIERLPVQAGCDLPNLGQTA